MFVLCRIIPICCLFEQMSKRKKILQKKVLCLLVIYLRYFVICLTHGFYGGTKLAQEKSEQMERDFN